MTPSATRHEWPRERERWAGFYAERLGVQLRQVSAFVNARRDKVDTLRPHFESCLTLLKATAGRHDLSPLWLELVDALHPLPLRWGFWSPWLDVLYQAAGKAVELTRPTARARYLAHMAGLLLDTAQADTALIKAQQALDEAGRAGDDYSLALAGSRAAGALSVLGRYDEAREVLIDVRHQLDALPANSNASLARALLDMEEMDLARQDGRLAEAIAIGDRLIAALEATTGIDPHDLATAYRRRSTILWAAGRYDEAAGDLIKSAEMFRAMGDPLAAVFSEGNLGVVYFSMGRFQLAETMKARAIRSAEELNAYWWLVRDTGELCGIYMYSGQLERALTYCHRHADLALRLGDERQLALARDNRGVTLMLLGRYDEARPDIEHSLRYFRDEGIIENTVLATLDMALFLRATGDWEQAAVLAEDSYSQANGLDFPILRILTTRCLALFRPPAEQRRLLHEALALAEAHERHMDVAGCLFSLAGLEPDTTERARLYDQAAAMLREMGAEAWLTNHQAATPPLLPMFY
ncbi:MAG: tetratricopeptide repeat protein [Candidatus Promineofilum sp.]|nr:tetratricopeptide repeat protein [Promineifilum sp.]